VSQPEAARENSATRSTDSSNDDLPEQLKPSDIQRSMAQIKTPVQECYGRYQVPGMVSITLTIEPSGRVSSAEATGTFAGTPTGECIASVVKGAVFPRFKGSAMTGIDYPFLLAR
jgi:hypothetical protein